MEVSLCGELLCNGIRDHVVSAILIANMGESLNIMELDLLGLIFSFIINFIASAIGCSSPKNPTILGPFRICVLPRIFRSISVKKATVNNIGKNVRVVCVMLIII